MALVTLKEILKDSKENKYAVGAFNVVDTVFLDSVLETAEEQNSPVILNVAEVHLPYINFKSLSAAILKAIDGLDIPVCLNLDHGLTTENIKKAIDYGFSSIMFDGSHYDFEENIAKTKEVVSLCKPHNISVEAELGAVGGAEGGELIGEANPAKYTDLEEAKVFVKETNIDALAVAIGNSHGKYKGIPKLDFDRLNDLNNAIDTPLVLHGGSGISDEDFRTAISMGIAKINFFTGMSQVALETSKAFFNNELLHYNDYLELNKSVKNEVKKVVKGQMDIFGSIKKA